MRLACLLVIAAFAGSATAAVAPPPRVFDIVPPPGRDVQSVDGFTVLRLPGKRFGAVLTFMPESRTHAWLPLAVLNTGTDALKVGSDGVTVRSAGVPLKVWSPTALVRWLKEGRTGLPPVDGAAAGSAADRSGVARIGGEAPIAPSSPETIGPVDPARQSQGGTSATVLNLRTTGGPSPAAQRARVSAARERLFRDAKLGVREIGRGDVLFALPPPGASAPAEFVVTLSFGGESMDVRYRERDPGPSGADR